MSVRPPCSGGREGGAGLPAEAELSPVAPQAMQDDGELAGDRDAGPRHASRLGDFMPQARRADHLQLRTSKVWAAL